jgi:hypothetical protein
VFALLGYEGGGCVRGGTMREVGRTSFAPGQLMTLLRD